MSLNSTLKTALESIAPTAPDVYLGDETTYIIFNYNSIPADFGNDAPAHERYLVQVHLYCPHSVNSLSMRRSIKTALTGAGFTWPAYENASDEEGQHHVFECEIAQEAGAD